MKLIGFIGPTALEIEGEDLQQDREEEEQIQILVAENDRTNMRSKARRFIGHRWF